MHRGVFGIAAKAVSRFPLRTPRPTASAVRRARAELERFRPDVSVVSDVLAWSLASRLLPAKPWIYDAHNVETALYRSFRDSASSIGNRVTFAIDYRRVAANERQALTLASALVAVSEEDANGLGAIARVPRSVVVPSSVPLPEHPCKPAEAAPVVLFVGSLDYPPNVAALEELVTAVMPAVRARRADARLVVVGRRPPRLVRGLLSESSWSELREDVADLGPSYRAARCVILPIRSGGGSRLKVFEALSYGLPLVATSMAIMGVPLTPGEDVLVASKPEDLARAAVRLIDDNDEAERLGAAGRETFITSLSWSRVSEPLIALLDELAADGAG